ncbi:2OG-Fe(II) oxygenase [Polynucleobacter nymphae]|uniref:2OG-Fe(II) oxygenase n=1 Tax=Polynucleobacter nymphae TaxID=2081043 RepID=UPI00210568A6|nr:2OG-Fe(II) oxygenase [Polynucleobacter nymphae]
MTISKEDFVKLILQKIEDSNLSIRQQWVNPVGTKTRHFFIDNLLPLDACESIYSAFPRDGDGFFSRESFREKKRTSSNLNAYSKILSNITYAFHDKKIVDRIAGAVEWDCIEPDPLLYAGGLSMMFRDDFLNPHLDNSHDGIRSKYRRLNLLYYVSPEWVIKNGGNLELWDENRTTPKTIVAKTNRLVVMETNRASWHSVSKVEADTPRCCVSNYYFSPISPDASSYFHVTSFTGRPEEKIKKIVGLGDNLFRNIISKVLKIGRGKNLINNEKE